MFIFITDEQALQMEELGFIEKLHIQITRKTSYMLKPEFDLFLAELMKDKLEGKLFEEVSHEVCP